MQGGGPKRIERQHAGGKQTARERLDALLDQDSFEEIGLFATHRQTLFGMEGLTRKVLILQASMPVGVLNYLFAQRYGRSPEQVASLVLVSTLLSVLTIPALLAWL